MTDIPVMYGVWIPKFGWLRGDNNMALMFTVKEIAIETSRRIGQKSKVYFIDQSLVDIEQQLLEAEQKNNISFFARIHRVLKAG